MKTRKELKELYDYIGDFIEWLALVKKDWKEGFINTKWKLISEGLVYDSVDNFIDWLARVEKYWKWGFINTKWEEVFWGLIFDGVNSFSEWFALVRKNWGYLYINTEGVFKENKKDFDEDSYNLKKIISPYDISSVIKYIHDNMDIGKMQYMSDCLYFYDVYEELLFKVPNKPLSEYSKIEREHLFSVL